MNNPKPVQLPPALRPKPLPKRPKGEISDSFAPITPATRPVPVTTPPPSAPSPTPAPVAPVPPSSAPAPTLKVRPKPSFRGRPAVAELEGRVVLFAGTFRPEGEPDFEVETPLTGNPQRDRQAIVNIARTRFPKGGLSLKSTRIFSKELGTRASYPKGTTVSQLFGPAGSLTESAVEVAEVFFQGEKCAVFLRNLRSRDSVTISLRASGGNPIVFSNRIAANSPAHTLPLIIKEVLGQDCRELKVTILIEK